jgi:hypothetical protein
MRRIGLGLAIGIWWAAAASASTDIRDVDQNGDGFASFAELTAVFDGATEIDFRNIDANSDSRISAIEIQSEVARMVLSRQTARQSTFSEVSAVDTDGDNVVSFFRTGGRLFWPVRR